MSNRNNEDTDNDSIEEDTLNHSPIDRNEFIPSPRPLRPTLSDISVSTSSTINDTQMDAFLSGFANNIRDSLTENLENMVQPMDGTISSHIQIDIPFEQFNAFATILAVVVFPIPLMPVNKYAFGILSALIEFVIVSATTSWPIRSSKVCGLYFNASTFELMFIYIRRLEPE